MCLLCMCSTVATTEAVPGQGHASSSLEEARTAQVRDVSHKAYTDTVTSTEQEMLLHLGAFHMDKLTACSTLHRTGS